MVIIGLYHKTEQADKFQCERLSKHPLLDIVKNERMANEITINDKSEDAPNGANISVRNNVVYIDGVKAPKTGA